MSRELEEAIERIAVSALVWTEDGLRAELLSLVKLSQEHGAREQGEKYSELVEACEDLGLSVYAPATGTPSILFHPPSDLPDNYRPSRCWNGIEGAYKDWAVTINAINVFNGALEEIRAQLPPSQGGQE